AVVRLIRDPRERRARATAAARVAAAQSGVLDEVLGRLAPWLDALASIRQQTASPAQRVKRRDLPAATEDARP
ncbi:MAG: hypothetical protein AB7H71_18990, partial [Alphaproteobacteria bacterium]